MAENTNDSAVLETEEELTSYIPNLTTISIICKFYNITLDEFFAPLHYPPKEK